MQDHEDNLKILGKLIFSLVLFVFPSLQEQRTVLACAIRVKCDVLVDAIGCDKMVLIHPNCNS
jgi:hypothetical protein